MTTVGVSASASGPGPGPVNFDDSSSVASDLSTLDFQGDFHTDLIDIILDIKPPGKFAFGAGIKTPSDFSISVNEVGKVALPLGESQARQITTKARQAPFGKGTDTFVDTSVRNTWELDPSQFTIGSVEWPAYLQSICRTAAQQMGIGTPIRAEIYKMLLYEEGAMFKPHTESLACLVLVISLPSKHSGGDVVLKHCGEKMVYKSSAYSISCAAWYSDVTHEVLPITSGYRWVLTYNLAVNQSQPAPSAALRRSASQPLRHCIRRWLAQDQDSRQSPYVYHILEHEYTEANISYKTLKGPDMTRVAAIRQACNGLPVAIFLALVEKMESGSVAFDPYDLQYGDDSDTSYHHIDDVLESELSVKITKDLDGNVVSGKMYIEEDHLLEPDAFDNITAAKEDYEGHTGNAGVQATHWYHIGGVIIVPYDSIGDFLCQSQSRSGGPIEKIPQTQINWLAQLCSKPDVQDYLLATMVDLVEYAVPHLESRGSRSTDTSMVSNILKAALLHKKHMLFQTVLAKLSSIVSSEWYGWLREWLIRDDGEAKTLERFNTVKNGLSLAMSSHDGLSHKFEAISNLTPLPKDLSPNALPTPEPIIDWARQMIHKFLDGNGPRDATIKDGSSVVNMAMYFEDPILFLTESLVPVFKKQISAPSFRFKVLSHLVVVTIEEKLPSNESMNLYRTMARSLIESQDFTLLRDARVLSAQEKKRTREPWRMGGVGIDLCRVRRELETAITHETLAKFFVSLLKVSTEIYNLTDEFMAKLIKQADKLPVVELSTMWIPFLQCSIEQMGLGSMLLTTPLYQKFFSALVLATLERYLGPEPPRPANWSMAGSKCSCADCERLSAFLAHPTQMSARFPMNKSRRYHLHRNIEAAGIGCAHVTDRSTNPNTMVVTKTTRPEDVILQQWQERRDQCAAKFGKFKVEHLMTLLGPNYAKIERLGPGPAQTPTSQSPVVGEKRTAATALEIIDLTED